MLLPCRLKIRISTASSATSMRPSTAEYPTLGWVMFQSATLGQFRIGGNNASGDNCPAHPLRLVRNEPAILLGRRRAAWAFQALNDPPRDGLAVDLAARANSFPPSYSDRARLRPWVGGSGTWAKVS